MQRFFAALLFFCNTLNAQICFRAFAGLSPNDQSGLIDSTFRALMDLPRGEAGQRLLLALDKAGDPFAVPSEDSDLFTARTRLSEFKEMLEQLGWNTPSVRQQLLGIVRERTGALSTAQANLARALVLPVSQTFKIIRAGDHASLSPNGQLLVGDNHWLDPRRVSLLDTATNGKASTFTLPPLSKLTVFQHGHPHWNADGTRILFLDGYRVAVHDVKDGQMSTEPQYVGKRSLWGLLTGGHLPQIRRMVPTNDPNQMLAQHDGHYGLYLYDLEKKTVRKVRGSDPIDPSAQFNTLYADWKFVPGTNTLVSVAQGKKGIIELKTGTLHPDGSAGPWKTVKSWPKPETRMELSDKGYNVEASDEYVIIRNGPKQGNLTVVSLRDGSEREIRTLIPETLTSDTSAMTMALHPNGYELGVNVTTREDGGYRSDFHWVDLDSGKYLGKFEARTDEAILAPDGERYLIRRRDFVDVETFRNRLTRP